MVYLEPPPQLLQLLHESLPDNTNNDDDDETAEILAYVATLTSSIQGYSNDEWIEAFEPYLSPLPVFTNGDNNNDEVTRTISAYLSKCQSLSSSHDESSDEEDAFGGEQITDIRFSLAYGGKILLHQTKLRLRRGHVYALVGQNGVGKTS
jgi:elongation factor 3